VSNDPTPPIEKLQRELVIYRDRIYESALVRRKLEWEAATTSTYGGFAAVTAAIADKASFMNIGLGIAALGLTNSTMFKFSDQSQAYVVALKKVSCVSNKVSSLDDATVSFAKNSNDPQAVATALNFPSRVVAAIDSIRIEYTNALLGIGPSVPSRDEILALIKTYAPAKGAAVALDEDSKRKEESGKLVLSLMSDIQACAK